MTGRDDVLTLDEVAAEMRMSKDYARKQCESGALKAKKLGNRWRIYRSDLAAFMRDGVPTTRRERDTRLTARQQKAAS